jgi:glucose/arabinose dehydrogenase
VTTPRVTRWRWYLSSYWRLGCAGAVAACALSLHGCGKSGDAPPLPVDAPGPSIALGVQRVFPNLNFTKPVAMLQAPNDSSRWFVVEQDGVVRVFANEQSAAIATAFVDITGRVTSGGETGLLGMAFHPNFPTNPHVYLSYTHTDPGPPAVLVSRISEFTSTDGGVTLDPARERILMWIVQPESNHNGGNIAFGPDGYLYVGMGDGGGGNDQHGTIGNGQLMTTLLGKMLRIDVQPASGYGIPPKGNVFPPGNALCGTDTAGGTGAQPCPEIYASGFRNPWRWSFDRQTGELWVGDVGQSAREEIDRVVAGGNYGWRCFEGTLGPDRLPCGSEPNLLPPIAEYGRSVGTTVTGGYVYRGTAIAGLAGRYVFGDYGSGRIWHIAANTAPTAQITGGFASGLNIASFGEGADGELYMVHYAGQLYRLTSP